jgi:hypothetical protein
MNGKNKALRHQHKSFVFANLYNQRNTSYLLYSPPCLNV